MVTSPVAEAASSRERAIAAIESRIELLAVLTDVLAQDPVHHDKVRQAREHMLALRQEVERLHVRRGPPARTPRVAAPA